MILIKKGELMAKRKGCPPGFTRGTRKKDMCYKKVKSISDLINLCNNGYNEYFLMLNYGGRSSKIIHYTPEVKNKPFDIWHLIDDTEERLSKEQLKDSNIGDWMKHGAFWCETEVK